MWGGEWFAGVCKVSFLDKTLTALYELNFYYLQRSSNNVNCLLCTIVMGACWCSGYLTARRSWVRTCLSFCSHILHNILTYLNMPTEQTNDAVITIKFNFSNIPVFFSFRLQTDSAFEKISPTWSWFMYIAAPRFFFKLQSHAPTQDTSAQALCRWFAHFQHLKEWEIQAIK